MDKVAGFHLHRGVLALGERRAAPISPPSSLPLPEPALVVIAAACPTTTMSGRLFRNAAALGADAVLLDGECCDPLYAGAAGVGGHRADLALGQAG